MIDVCARCQKLSSAELVFRQMDTAGIERDIAIFNAMVKACAMCGEQLQAIEHFRCIPSSVMHQASEENKQVAYQSVMIAAARSADDAQAREFVRLTPHPPTPRYIFETAVGPCRR